MKNKNIISKGFSVIEVILAAAIFMLFSTAAVIVILGGYNTNRLGAEETIANQFASEGVEAAKSIKNQAYSNLITPNPTPRAVVTPGGVWAFGADGSSNTLIHNSNDNYIRQVKVENVNRDCSGNIVTSGTNDPDTKKITSTVSWKFNSARPESVVLSTYLSDWRNPISTNKGGILVYGDNVPAADAIKYRVLDPTAGTWNSAAQVADVDASTNRVARAMRLYSSSTRNEKILISRHYDSASQYIYAQVYNGTTWGNVNSLATFLNVTTFLDVRNFDGTYLNNGDFMVVYSDNSSTPKFKTWDGCNWSTAAIATQPISNIPNYIVLRNRPGTNGAMAAFFDQSKRTNTQYFYLGSNNIYETTDWTLHTPPHSTNAPTNTKQHIDFVWSPNATGTGALVYPDAVNDKNITLKIWTASGVGGGSWGSAANASNQGTLGAMSIDGRFGGNEFLTCNKDASNDIYCFKSDFTPLLSPPTSNPLTATTDTGIQRSYDFAFESLTGTNGLAVYSNNTSTPKKRIYTPGVSPSFTAETSLTTALGGVLKTVRTRQFQDNDDIMILMGDANNDLYTIVWNGSINDIYTSPSGKAKTTQGTNGFATTDFWYDFAWDRF